MCPKNHQSPTYFCETDREVKIYPDLHVRKRALLDNGGNVFDMAVAMQERTTMKADYPPERYPNGTLKTDDAFNYGIFKQNWLMIRNSWPPFKNMNYGPQDYRKGAPLNSNLSLDIQILHASLHYFGVTDWFAGHRGGISGIPHWAARLGYPRFSGPRWPQSDIDNYRDAIEWIRTLLITRRDRQTDDSRCGVEIPPV